MASRSGVEEVIPKPARSRLDKELQMLLKEPEPLIHVSRDETDILSWSYLLEGPSDTPYEGGWYWGKIRFPKEYPFKPPSIQMHTPNGRFVANTRLCLSMSDYHPESWAPQWSIGAVLKGLLSFMIEETQTAGSIHPLPPEAERRRLAASSLAWNKSQSEFMEAFPHIDDIATEPADKLPMERKANEMERAPFEIVGDATNDARAGLDAANHSAGGSAAVVGGPFDGGLPAAARTARNHDRCSYRCPYKCTIL
eukprot:TRINITY_DN80326_c0_g1_i1.p1 TRINITY_DN80326_c0_g1~~TRINITY_DN80326_c0_g1_i1.p1  ORF type:complete len:253 (+),score=19.68 TRINITY_DN80326_c0_g1_i1:88-846(+)